MPRISRAAPPNDASRGRHHCIGSQCSVEVGVPLGGNVWKERSEAVGHGDAAIGAEGTTGAARAIVWLGAPAMVRPARADPPDSAARACRHLARFQVAVTFVVPLPGQLRKAIDPILRSRTRR